MRTNSSGVTEVAHIRTNLQNFSEGWDRIDWGKDKKQSEEPPILELKSEVEELREAVELFASIIDWAEWAQDNEWYAKRDRAMEIHEKLFPSKVDK